MSIHKGISGVESNAPDQHRLQEFEKDEEARVAIFCRGVSDKELAGSPREEEN